MTIRKCLIAVLSLVLISLAGCTEYHAQPGETVGEGHRRHLRNLRVQRQQLLDDLDTFMLTDKPSKLTDKNIP